MGRNLIVCVDSRLRRDGETKRERKEEAGGAKELVTWVFASYHLLSSPLSALHRKHTYPFCWLLSVRPRARDRGRKLS